MACIINWEKSLTNFVIIWFSIFIVNLKCQSFLDVEEISRMKYGVIISNDPVLFHEKVGENELIVSSKHGQQYICSLPEIQLNFDDDQKSPSAQFNLVTKILDEAFNGSCLVHHKGWWSYKVCHKDKVEQFHVASGAKISAVTLLGVYESEDHWNASINESEIQSGRVHNQKYTNGAVCDLTMKPRSTQVKYICGENNGIIQVDEPESCQYIVTISSLKLCSHPLFKKQEEYEHFNMVCSPSLSQEAYDKYIRKKSKEKSSEEFEKKIEKETDAVENKKPDTNIFQDLKETANGLSMLFGSLFGDLSESMQKMASSPLKIESTAESSEEKQEIITNNEVLEDISENKKSSQYEKLGSAKTSLEEADVKDKLAPEDTVGDKFYSRKAQLSMEYAQLKKSAKEEIQMSKKMLEKMQNRLDESETPVEKSEWEKVVELLRDNIGKFDKQMSVLDQQMTEIEQVEAEAEKHLHIVDEEIKNEKKLQNIANALKSSKTVKKSLIDRTTEKISKSKSKNAKASQNSLAASLKQLDEIYKIFRKGLSDVQKKDAQPKELHKLDETSRKVFDQLQEQDSEKSKTNLNEPVTDFNKKHTQNKDSVKRSDENLPKVEEKTYSKILEKDKSKENDENMLEIKFGVQSFDDPPSDVGDDDEILGVDKSANEIEEAVKKQLQEAGFKMNDNIKIKIITSKEKFDKYTASSKVLSTSTSFDFKDLLMGLLGNNKEKESEENRYNALQNNYDTVWDQKEEVEEEKD